MYRLNAYFPSTFALAFSVSLLALFGCEQEPKGGGATATPPASTDGGNAHPTEGPHHGGIIELGNEEYHGELLHDEDAGSVTIYILDSAAKNAVAIDATQLTINVSHQGNAEQFTLAANPDADDPAGKSSRFTSTDPELAGELDHDAVEAHLVVAIDGKQYRGAISHDDDHQGYNH